MKLKGERGGTLIELALVMPLLCILLFGIIEFGFVLYDQAMITNASREGARAGIVYSFPDPIPDSEITAVVENYCKEHLIGFPRGTPTINIIRTEYAPPRHDDLTVRVVYPYTFLLLPNLPYIGLPSQLPLQAETVMRMEEE